MSHVLVENGRIVLQYRNVHAGRDTTTTTTTTTAATDSCTPAAGAVTDRTGSGHARTRSGHATELDQYDMNDVVWKNVAASSDK